MNQEERNKQMAKLVAKCWSDEGFKKALLANPAATLKAQGIDLPAGVTVTVHENTATAFHLVIPAKRTDLSDADLDKVSAGYCSGRLPENIPNLPGGSEGPDDRDYKRRR